VIRTITTSLRIGAPAKERLSRHSGWIPTSLFLIVLSGCAGHSDPKVQETTSPRGTGSEQTACTLLPLPQRSPERLGGGLLDCQPLDCPSCGMGEFPRDPNLVTVKAVVHFMETEIPQSERKDVPPERRHLVAPIDQTSRYWTGKEVRGPENEAALKVLFACDGLVNRIWNKEGKGIHVSLVGGEVCTYQEEQRPVLRMETKLRSKRDSIYLPDPSASLTPAPWAAELFRSINQLFTAREPGILHIVTWWSVSERESADENSTDVQGYSRAAGRGGPAVWVGTQFCVDQPQSYTSCSKLLAHEIGHALGLHHVLEGDVPVFTKNLMFKKHSGSSVEPWQIEEARNEARRLLNSR
jgi:hypothetical protein